MASLELLISITAFGGVLAFVLGRWNKILGSGMTILVSGFVFVSLTYYGLNDSLDMAVSYLPDGFAFASNYLGMFFAIIVTFVFFMVSFFNPFFIEKYKYPALYSMLYLFILAGSLGVFFSTNFIELFFFFEFVVWTSLFLIPMGKSKSAAVMYYGFSAVGSFALLFAVLVMANAAGSYDIETGLAAVSGGNLVIVFILLMVAAFSKLGAFPLHIWLPVTHGNAPDPFSPVLSGGLVKLGAFVAVMGLVKLAPVGFTIDAINLPFGQLVIAVLGALTIVFGTLMAIREDDAKRLLAYSSVSHGGYILVALALLDTVGITGGLYHVVAHALASTAGFLAIAAVSRVTGTTKMSELGGIIHKMPITYIVYLVAIISMAGIPPMGGFVSKWLIFQAVIDRGMILVAMAAFFGSIGSFLYVFRPLAALFLGQELPQFKTKVKEAPVLMLIPMVILTGLNIYTGVLPNTILKFTNKILVELNVSPIVLGDYYIQGYNGKLNPALIAGIFGVGVLVAFIIFILLKKSKKVGLMDTYTAGNFIYTEELLHYTTDFYAPLERLYEKYIHIMTNFYKNLAHKVKEFGRVVKYFFFTYKPEIMVFWIVVIMTFLLWGEVL
jgi:NADH-quinone oxidoreductase subunit M